MSVQDEWWPWIEHDGKGCPCVGRWVQVKSLSFLSQKTMHVEGIAGSGGGISWDWTMYGKPYGGVIVAKIMCYRIRKPRGMAIMESILTDLPAPIKRVDA